MPTYVVTKDDIDELKARLDRIKVLADEGDEVAQVALDAIGYAHLLQAELRQLQEEHKSLTSLVFQQSNLIEHIVNILTAMDMKVPMPETPDDLPGYG